jgi:hypothetical protein
LVSLEWVLIVAAVAGLAGVAFWLAWDSVGGGAGQAAGQEHFPAATLAASHITADARAALPPTTDAAAVEAVNEHYGRECERLMLAYRDIGLEVRWVPAEPTDVRGNFDGEVPSGEVPPRVVCLVGEARPAAAQQEVEDESGPELFVVGAVSGSEGASVSVRVGLSPAWGRLVSVDYVTVAGSALRGRDFEAVEGTLRFAPGNQRLEVSIFLPPDENADEGDESFEFCLENPTGGARLRVGAECATVTVRDGDAVVLPSVSVSDARPQVEGRSLRFAVTLSAPAPSPVSVRVVTAEPRRGRAVVEGRVASEGRDYSAVDRFVSIPLGGRSASVTVATVNDDLYELPEVFEVHLSERDVVGAVVADGEATGTILDDDDRRPTVSVADAVPVTEDAGPMSFRLSLDRPSGVAVAARLATEDVTASAGDDYKALTEVGTEVVIPAGFTRWLVEVELIDDTESEFPESFVLRIESASGAEVSRTEGEAVGLILDDENPRPVVSVVDAAPVTEGEAARFEVRLSRSATEAVTVSYETDADGEARGGTICGGSVDFVHAADGTVTLPAGSTSLFVEVATCDDTAVESPRELFSLSLTGVSGGPYAAIGDGEATGTILDDDAIPEVSVADAEAREDAEAVVFTVSLSGRSSRQVSVPWWSAPHPTATYPAAAEEDFTEVRGVLTIPAGTTSATVSVPVLDDLFDEYDETFWLRLGAPTGATVAGGGGLAVGTIRDDDPRPRLSIANEEELEGDVLSFEVRLLDGDGNSVESGRLVTASVSSSDGTATAGSDYTAISQEPVSLPPGQTKATVTVASLEDEEPEDDETFTVYLAGNTNADLAGGGRAVGTILDDEEPRLSVADVTVTEGVDSDATFTVTLSRAAEGDVTFGYATGQVPDSASAGTECDAADTEDPADYLSLPAAEATIAAGDTEFSVDVTICDDDAVEDNEIFLLTLTDIEGAEAAEAADGDTDTATATGTIIDDDGPPRITVNNPEAAEGDGTITFDVTVSRAAEADIEAEEPGGLRRCNLEGAVRPTVGE